MPIANYGVWTATPVRVSAETAVQDPTSPHIHLFYDDGTGGNFAHARRASINVKSLSAISELVFWHIPDFRHPVTAQLRGLAPGFKRLPPAAGTLALDYIRGNLIDFAAGRVLDHDLPGDDNDIIDFVMPELQSAILRGARVHLFGEPYSDNQGIHDIHMNQGSAGQFARFNGVWQDGAVLIDYASENRFAALFFAFASQAMHTSETTGNALPGSQTLSQFLTGQPAPIPVEPGEPAPVPIPEDRRVAIVAALVNPVGPENTPSAIGRPESVWLINRSDTSLSLGGWQVLNRMDEAHTIAADTFLAPGEVRPIAVTGAPLSNRGGTISLLDAQGIKVDGVVYLAEEAREEGTILIFRR